LALLAEIQLPAADFSHADAHLCRLQCSDSNFKQLEAVAGIGNWVVAMEVQGLDLKRIGSLWRRFRRL
jgi:hypothetical protein